MAFINRFLPHTLALLLIIAAFTLPACKQTYSYADVTIVQAKELIEKHKSDSNFAIIDIRTPEEYAEGHIPGSANINFNSSDFEKNLNMLDKNKSYLVYCRSGNRSTKSLPVFEKLGFKSVYHMKDGYKEFEK